MTGKQQNEHLTWRNHNLELNVMQVTNNIHAEWSDHKWTALITSGSMTKKHWRCILDQITQITFGGVLSHVWPYCFSFQKWEHQSVLCHIKEQPTELKSSVSGSVIFKCNKISFTVLLYFDYCMQCNFFLHCSLLIKWSFKIVLWI